MEAIKWSPLRRSYDKEKESAALPLQQTSTHPLLPTRRQPAIVSQPKDKNLASSASTIRKSVATADPLSSPLGDPLSDPLSAMAIADDPLSSSSSTTTKLNSEEAHRQNAEISRQAAIEIHEKNLRTPWQLKKEQIASDYTVSGTIRLRSTAFADVAGTGLEEGNSSSQVDKYSQRLAGLERRSVLDNTVEMSQKEYQANVAKLSQDLTKAWSNDERVASLKIVIQLAKLLGDTSMPQFYPSTFVVVTNELDRFGDMVYSRLLSKSEDALNEGSMNTKKRIKLPDDFKAAHVPTSVKEICRNWFYKTACIRELLPRVYVELALLKCYRFLADGEFPQILSRISSVIRGLGDPLVALYARTYLVVQGNEVLPENVTHAVSVLRDQLFCFTMLRGPAFLAELKQVGVEPNEYSRLMSPGIEWMCKTVGKAKSSSLGGGVGGSGVSSKDIFQSVLRQYKEHCNDAMVLNHIIDSFDGSHYSHVALGLAGLVKEALSSCVSSVEVFTALGKQLSVFPPPEEQRIPLLSEVWRIVGKCDQIETYVKCNAAWLELAQRHCSEREVLILLSDLANKLSVYSAKEAAAAGIPTHTVQLQELPESVQPHLASLIESLIAQASTQTDLWTAVITSDHLPKLLDSLMNSKRVSLCKDILESLRFLPSTGDAVLINALFTIARTVHDSIDYLTPDGEKKFISQLLCRFIDKVDFGKDLEQQLNVYVECRAIFCNLDTVRDKLVYKVSDLAMRAFRCMKGKHSKKTGAFVKAALAYCYITIASIDDVRRRLVLLLHSAQIALLNQCLPQTDAFLKAAITMIPEFPPYDDTQEGRRTHTEEKLAEYVRKLLSTLVITPGHPVHGPFYIVQGLLNALPKFSWQATTGVQTRLYIDMLALLCTYAQYRLPYHIPSVDSNDDLYCCSPAYMEELGTSVTTCVTEILRQMTQLGARTEPLAKISQARCALDLANKLVSCMALSDEISGFVVNLLELANKMKSGFSRTEIRYFSLSVDFVKQQVMKEGRATSIIPRINALQTPV